jgi:hypothetical protein
MDVNENRKLIESKENFEINLEYLLNEVINNKTNSIKIDKYIFEKEFIELGVINEYNNDSRHLELNTDSDLISYVLLNIAEKKLAKTLPKNIDEAIKFTEEFEEEIKKPNENVIWSGSFQLVQNLEKYVVLYLNQNFSVNVTVFFDSLPKESYDRKKHLRSFENIYFEVFPYLKMTVEEIYDSTILLYNEKRTNHNVINLYRRYGNYNFKIAKQLYNYGITRDIIKYPNLISSLLIGLFNNGDKEAFENTVKLLESNKKEALIALGKFNYQDTILISKCFSIINSVKKEEIDSIFQLPYLLVELIKNEHSSEDIKNKCFEKIEELIKIGNVNLNSSLIFNLKLLKSYEEKKYELLHIYLSNKGSKIEVIKDYFSRFENPQYFFHLYLLIYSKTGFRTNINLFENSLMHFWNINPIETEKELLEVLTEESPFYRYGAIKLITSKLKNPYNVNLLKIKTEKNQIRAIRAIVEYPIGIEGLLPIILSLKNSPFPNVIKVLQKELSVLIDEAYGKNLFDLIEKNIDKKKDKSFYNSMKRALKKYTQKIEFKNSIKDLNPYINEKELMDLYYTLEDEQQVKTMSEMRNKDSFLSNIGGKERVIVRGNSWKIGDNKEASKLGHFSFSAMIDLRAYKNPYLFENKLSNSQIQTD